MPMRNFINNLWEKERAQIEEERIIGTTLRYNPRVEEIQKILKKLGFDPGSTDGIMGNQTRGAIREFQKGKGIRPSGKIDSKTWIELQRELLSKEQIATPLPSFPERNLVKAISEEAIKSIEHQKSTKEKPPKDKKKQIQIALQNAGFYTGKIDGRIGPKTKEAIKAFQKANGLKPDGIVGRQTWEKLSKYL